MGSVDVLLIAQISRTFPEIRALQKSEPRVFWPLCPPPPPLYGKFAYTSSLFFPGTIRWLKHIKYWGQLFKAGLILTTG